ncbi:MAG: ABC transporter substrate-binding protein, partial [Desulfobacteraceae bacterium]
LGIFGLSLLTATPVIADSQAKTVLKSAIDDVLLILKGASNDDEGRRNAFNKIYDRIGQTFDFQMLAMGALGRKRKSFSPDQLDQFTALFSKLVAETYFEKLEGSDTSGVEIQYLECIEVKSKRKSVQRFDVETLIKQDNVNIPIIYRMINKNQTAWKVYDIKIEGVSMVANYRDQYRSKMNATPDDLIQELKQKVEP